jgi:hypothetical protein
MPSWAVPPDELAPRPVQQVPPSEPVQPSMEQEEPLASWVAEELVAERVLPVREAGGAVRTRVAPTPPGLALKLEPMPVEHPPHRSPYG